MTSAFLGVSDTSWWLCQPIISFWPAPWSWNSGKSGAKLDLTSPTTTGLQIHKVDHTQTANPCDWLPCCRAALLLVGYPHSLVYLHLPVVEGLIFCISATPHLGTSFPLFQTLNRCVKSIF